MNQHEYRINKRKAFAREHTWENTVSKIWEYISKTETILSKDAMKYKETEAG